MAKDLKLTASLDDKISPALLKIIANTESTSKKIADGQRRMLEQQAREEEKFSAYKARLQINSIATENRLQAQREREISSSLRRQEADHARSVADFIRAEQLKEREAVRIANQMARDQARAEKERELAQKNSLGSQVAAGVFGGYLGAQGVMTAISATKEFVKESVDLSLKLQGVQRALEFSAGSAIGGADAFEFLKETSKRLGISLEGVLDPFAKFNASAHLAGLSAKSTKAVFLGISEAAVSMNLSAEQTSGALYALQQMLDKGTVQSQELKLQLGNALPGALGLASRAMGLTTAQFTKMLENGEIVSSDFLPKFAAQLHRTFGETAVKASGQGQASIEKFNNEVLLLKTSFGDALIPSLTNVTKELTKFIQEADKAGDIKAIFSGISYAAKAMEISIHSAGIAYGLLTHPVKEVYDISKNLINSFREQKTAVDSLADSQAELFKVESSSIDMPSHKARAEMWKKFEEKQKKEKKEAEKAAKKDQEESDAEFDSQAEKVNRKREERFQQAVKDRKQHYKETSIQVAKEEEDERKQLAFENHAKALKKQIDNEIAANKKAAFSAVSNLVSESFGQSKIAFAAEKALAAASIVVNTQEGAAKALALGPVGIPLAHSIEVLGGIELATVLATAIKGFKDGGYTGSGYSDEVAGVVHRGEYVLNRQDLSNMGGVAGVEAAKNGGSTITHTGDVVLNISIPGGSPAQARAAGREAAAAYTAHLRSIAKANDDIRSRRTRA